MMIGPVRKGLEDSAACFIHTMDVSVQRPDKEYTTVLLSEGVTLLILTEAIRFFSLSLSLSLCVVPSD